MEYQKIINFVRKYTKSSNSAIQFRTKNWVEINDDSHGTHNTNSHIKFRTSTLRTSLYDYNDAYIFVSGTITITGAGNDDAVRRLDERNKGVIFKTCTIHWLHK